MNRPTIGLALIFVALATQAQAAQSVWNFTILSRIGGLTPKVEGHPTVVDSPTGKAVQFDGKADSLFFPDRPLVGAKTFTIEAIFRPEGGQFQQRFMHIAETDRATGLDALPTGANDPNPRFMFEVRVVEGGWYLDAFVNSKSGQKALIDKDKVHPLNRWYAVAQTYDGVTYRAFVDGVLQAEAATEFTPHGPGHVRVGSRMNHVDYFKGAIATARFTDRALTPDQFLKVYN